MRTPCRRPYSRGDEDLSLEHGFEQQLISVLRIRCSCIMVYACCYTVEQETYFKLIIPIVDGSWAGFTFEALGQPLRLCHSIGPRSLSVVTAPLAEQ